MRLHVVVQNQQIRAVSTFVEQAIVHVASLRVVRLGRHSSNESHTRDPTLTVVVVARRRADSTITTLHTLATFFAEIHGQSCAGDATSSIFGRLAQATPHARASSRKIAAQVTTNLNRLGVHRHLEVVVRNPHRLSATVIQHKDVGELGRILQRKTLLQCLHRIRDRFHVVTQQDVDRRPLFLGVGSSKSFMYRAPRQIGRHILKLNSSPETKLTNSLKIIMAYMTHDINGTFPIQYPSPASASTLTVELEHPSVSLAGNVCVSR